MGESRVTIVCCYNDLMQYQAFENSLKGQNTEYTLLGIDNRGQKFSSCAAALNSAAGQIETEYVIYAHQDIALPKPDMLARFAAYLGLLGPEDILGVAGAVWDGSGSAGEQTCVLSKVRHGKALAEAGERDYSGTAECETVDECFFGGHAEFFRAHPFDEALCDDWHLYAVERCLFTRMRGNRVYVCDIPLVHFSGGAIGHAYNRGFYRLARRYAGYARRGGAGRKITWLRTVCGSSRTDWFHRTCFYWKREILIRMGRYQNG